jgi:hypothetical protein
LPEGEPTKPRKYRPTQRKGQAALEFFSTYGIAIVIIVIVAVVIYIALTIAQATPQNQCSFSGYVACKDLVFGSNAIASRFIFLFSNMQEYPIENTQATINITGVGTFGSGPCSPGFILPGGVAECVINLTQPLSAGQLASGNISLSATVCTQLSQQCGSPLSQSYGATFTAHVSPLIPSPGCSLSLSAANATQPDSGTGDLLTANVEILNYPIAGETVNFTANSLGVSISPQYANTNSNGTVQSYASSRSAASALITAASGGCAGSATINFFTPT